MTHPLTAEVSLGQEESGYREGWREGAWGDGGGGRISYSIGENYQTATQIPSQPEQFSPRTLPFLPPQLWPLRYICQHWAQPLDYSSG